MAKKLTDSVREKNDVNVSIGRVSLSYLGSVQLEDIYIEDHHEEMLLKAASLRTSIIGFVNLFQNSPHLGHTTVEAMDMRMRHYEGEEHDNLNVLISKLRREPTGDTTAFKLDVNEVDILNSRYSYIDENLENAEILVLDNLNIHAYNLEINNSDVNADISHLDGREKRGFNIVDLNTRFSYTQTGMQLEDLQLQSTESYIDGEIVLDYAPGDFSDFVNKVDVTAQFEEAVVSTNDLVLFYNEFGEDQLFRFNGELIGNLNDFQLNEFDLRALDRSGINGDFRVEGAFSEEGEDFRLTGSFSNFSSNYYDLVNLLPGILKEVLPEYLRDFGNINLNGNAVITPTSLDTDVLIKTQLGSAEADVAMRDLNNAAVASYDGHVVFKDFNLGRLINNEKVGSTSLDVMIDGSGFSGESLNTQVRGIISKLTYNEYTYSNMRVIGNLQYPVFNGDLISNDPNLRMEFSGLADITEDISVYDFEASVSYADLNALNFVSRDSISIFKGDVMMNMRGTNIDNAYGRILLLNTSYQNQNDLYYFDDFSIVSSFDGPVRTLEINSPDVISGEVEGVFSLSEVGALIQNSFGSIYTNYQPRTITNDQYMDFDFDIYNKIVEVFYPEITLAPNTFIRGRVETDESEFKLNFSSPQIDAFGNMFEDVSLRLDNTNPIYNTYAEADSVSTDFYNFSEFSLINVTQRDTLFIRSEFQGGKENNDLFNLNFFHTINEDNQSVVGIQRSDLTFKGNTWYLNEEGNRSNKVVIDPNFRDFEIDSVVMSHRDEEIRFSGSLRDSTYKNFRMNFNDVEIGKITPEIDSLDLAGTLNGNFDLLQEDGAYYPNTSMFIENFVINDNLMGNLDIDVEGNEDLTSYAINASLRREDYESLRAIGSIDVGAGEPAINMDVDLRRLNLAAFSPLGGEVLSNIRGYTSGKATVSGNYKNPEFSGELVLNDAGLAIPYLNVDLDLEEGAVVGLSNQQFNFRNIEITDTKYQTQGILGGNISHRNFREWFMDLDLSTDRLLVLDTEAEEDALYYGTAFIGGQASIEGPTDELVIEVTATTEKGTTFKIPLNETESIGDNSYIHFLSPQEKAARRAGEDIELPDIKGLELIFDLDVTNDAEVEVVIDQTSGSTLRGRGAGNLLLEINTSGKFNMWGDFVVYEGVYNFKYAGLVEKIFRVKSGGNINWNGNPLQAQLDVSAVYELDANPAVLLENPSINRNIPVEVVILLQGQVTQPDITFDIEFPSASSVVRSEIEYRMDDRASRELQALFLVTQGTFYNEFELNQNAITGNLAERASSLVNDVFADEDGKFQVGVNYEQGFRTPEQQGIDRFGLTLSTQITDRVLLDGQVGVPIGGYTESVIVGDVEISFLLNEDGSLRATVFNRENNIQFIGEEIGFTQGLGLSYSVDFNTFRELIGRIVDTELEKGRREEEEAEEAAGEIIAPDYIEFPAEDEN